MKKPKYYFNSIDSEMAYDLEYHFDNARCEGFTEIELFEAIPDRDPNYFFCKAVQEVGEKGDCGKQCGDYDPRNKISGICKHKGKCYDFGNKVVFKVE